MIYTESLIQIELLSLLLCRDLDLLVSLLDTLFNRSLVYKLLTELDTFSLEFKTLIIYAMYYSYINTRTKPSVLILSVVHSLNNCNNIIKDFNLY